MTGSTSRPPEYIASWHASNTTSGRSFPNVAATFSCCLRVGNTAISHATWSGASEEKGWIALQGIVLRVCVVSGLNIQLHVVGELNGKACVEQQNASRSCVETALPATVPASQACKGRSIQRIAVRIVHIPSGQLAPPINTRHPDGLFKSCCLQREQAFSMTLVSIEPRSCRVLSHDRAQSFGKF